MTYEEIEATILRSMDALGTKPEDHAEMIQRCLAKKAQQRAECGESSKVSRLDVQENGNQEEGLNLRLSDESDGWLIHKSRNSKRKERKAKRNEMWGLRSNEVEGPFLKVGSKAKDSEVFFRDPVLKLCSASGSTPLQQSKFEGFGKRLGNFHSLPCALDGSTPQQAPSFSTPRGSCNDNSICANVDEASPFGLPEFVLNCEPDDSEDVATRPLSKMMGRHGVQADKASDLVESTVSLGDRSLCHRAPLLASVTASLLLWLVVVLVFHLVVVVVHVVGACGVALCCSCCGSGLVDGESDICGRCMSGAHGCDMFNSCVVHGEGQVAKRVHQGVGETKSKRTCTRSGVRQPLEGLMPVGDELATDPRRVSGKVHVEVRDGRSCATKYGTRLVELGKGCEVVVKIPCVPEKALMVGVFVSPRPGVPLRETWGWKPLLHTLSSGVWVLPGALQSFGFLDLLDAAASWFSRSTYRTAWAVCPWSGCQFSYSYGQGPAIGPHTG